MWVVLTTDQKRAVAELAIAHAAIKLGVGVYRPLVEGGRCDLILELGAVLVRTQCKWARRHGDVVTTRCYSARRTREGLRKRLYAAADVDAIAAYCPELDRCFFVSADRFDGHCELSLRLAASGNNQRQRVNWAEDFAFEARLLALLGP